MEDVDTEILQIQGHRHSPLIVCLGGMGQGDLSQSTKIRKSRDYTCYWEISSAFCFVALGMLPWSETPHVKRRSLRFDARRVLSKQVRSQTVIEVVKSRAFQIVCTWGLHWPWKSTTQQNNHQQTVSANMAPRNNINKKQTKRYRLSVGDKSTGSAGTVQGSLHVFFFFSFEDVVCVIPCDTLSQTHF